MSSRQDSAMLLEFTNPVFNNGLNATVRRGRKWEHARHAVVKLATNHTVYTDGMVTRTIKFSELEACDVKHEHDPACRTIDGLFKVMQEVYPGFTREEDVTLIYFIITRVTPEIGQDVYVPDMYPVLVGKLTEVIELNDRFWELHYTVKTQEGDLQAQSFIVSEYEWDRSLMGWFDTKYYERRRNELTKKVSEKS
ncbi:hypothetical protein Xoosp13_354 [Xanthomonas phage Xoo-sp13]|nr:hypothetical protein Xoosp13_354 [Xanthomonas phage Xoo-sp13]